MTIHPACFESDVALAWPAMCRRARAGDRKAIAILCRAAGLPVPTPAHLDDPAPTIPRRPDGRISVGLIAPCCYTGGGERWMATLLRYCCPEVVHWEGIAVGVGGAVDPRMRDELAATAPVESGPGAFARLYASCEVVISWGMMAGDQRVPRPRACKIALVSHGSGGWTSGVFGDPRDSDAWVAVSEAALKPIPPRFRSRAIVLPNGVDRARLAVRKSRLAIRREWGIDPDAFVPLYLGRLSNEKNPEAFIDGMAALARQRPALPFVGVMAGDGLEAARYASYAMRMAPGRVRMVGVRDDVGDVLRAADALIMPSREEAAPLATLEAWTLGVPVVSTPVGLMIEPRLARLARVVPQGPSGDQVASALLADLDDPEGTRARCREARSVAREEFGHEAFGRRWTEFIVRLARPEAPVPAPCGCGQEKG